MNLDGLDAVQVEVTSFPLAVPQPCPSALAGRHTGREG